MSDAPVICWFRQDLRLSDHPSLSAAARSGAPVIPVFILDDSDDARWAMGGASLWWLHHSLVSLGVRLAKAGSPLVLRRGAYADVLCDVVRATGARQVQWTRCYEPAARALDDEIKSLLEGKGVTCKRFAGNLIFEPEEISTGAGTPYKVYTPFWRACLAKNVVIKPLPAAKTLAAPDAVPESDALDDWGLLPHQPDWSGGFDTMWSPGEIGARNKLTTFISTAMTTYGSDRDRPDRDGTSQLSPHLHFGEISPRQCWAAVSHAGDAGGEAQSEGASKFLSEIGWREFAHHLLFHWPTLPEEPFRAEFSSFPWAKDDAQLRAWQRGQTGYPIVDAGMRQLWQTGWMHNRVRMIVASFLIKHLLVPWQDGEAWFWDTLVDANLANNAAGWQWVAGSGADASPYFRIFNPISQGKKFDPDGAYVREFVPELAELPRAVIHEPWTATPMELAQAGVTPGETYPHPIVDHKEARQRALDGYKALRDGG